MPRAGNKAEELLDIAERLARAGGYGGFSFRDLAAEAGIKSASVHYHFPSKEDLGEALARRYTERFLAGLDTEVSDDMTAQQKVELYVQAFRRSLVVDRLMCLCGIFGAEISTLPPRVAGETRAFFDHNRDWLIAALSGDERYPDPASRDQAALALIARLEGAMILARSLDDPSVFDRIMQAGDDGPAA